MALFIKHGASPLERDYKGETALMIASKYDQSIAFAFFPILFLGVWLAIETWGTHLGPRQWGQHSAPLCCHEWKPEYFLNRTEESVDITQVILDNLYGKQLIRTVNFHMKTPIDVLLLSSLWGSRLQRKRSIGRPVIIQGSTMQSIPICITIHTILFSLPSLATSRLIRRCCWSLSWLSMEFLFILRSFTLFSMSFILSMNMDSSLFVSSPSICGSIWFSRILVTLLTSITVLLPRLRTFRAANQRMRRWWKDRAIIPRCSVPRVKLSVPIVRNTASFVIPAFLRWTTIVFLFSDGCEEVGPWINNCVGAHKYPLFCSYSMRVLHRLLIDSSCSFWFCRLLYWASTTTSFIYIWRVGHFLFHWQP